MAGKYPGFWVVLPHGEKTACCLPQIILFTYLTLTVKFMLDKFMLDKFMLDKFCLVYAYMHADFMNGKMFTEPDLRKFCSA